MRKYLTVFAFFVIIVSFLLATQFKDPISVGEVSWSCSGTLCTVKFQVESSYDSSVIKKFSVKGLTRIHGKSAGSKNAGTQIIEIKIPPNKVTTVQRKLEFKRSPDFIVVIAVAGNS